MSAQEQYPGAIFKTPWRFLSASLPWKTIAVLVLVGFVAPDAHRRSDSSSWAEQSWVGKTVILKLDGENDLGPDDLNQHYVPAISFIVRDQDKDQIKIGTGQAQTWILESQAVLVDDAIDYFSAAKPVSWQSLLCRAEARQLSGDLDGAIDDCDAAIQMAPKCAFAYHKRGCLRSDARQYQKSLEDFDQAMLLDPLVSLYVSNRAAAWERLQDFPKALKDYDRSLEIDANNACAFVGRGYTRYRMGQYDEAIADFDKAIRHSPEFSAAYVDRGLAFNAKKDYVAALKDFDTAIKLEPQEISTLDFALNAKAWTLATCPLAAHRDGKTAVELATKACKITRWNSPDCLGTLAAAYAETGQFEEAVRWQEKALTDDEYRKEWGATAENCSKQYRNGMPHREE